MNEENKLKALNVFQQNAFKGYRTLGFSADNANTIFGIIIEMRNLVLAAEAQDTILLHKHMGLCTEVLANYATINSIKLEVVVYKSHEEITKTTVLTDLEHYLEQIKNDLSFVKDMKDEDKIEFVQKCWACIFPEEYCDDFLKIDRILKSTIEDNKIKYPDMYFNRPSNGSKYGME